MKIKLQDHDLIIKYEQWFQVVMHTILKTSSVDPPVVHFLRCAPYPIQECSEFSSCNQLLSSYKSCMLNEKKIASQQRFELIEEYVVIPSNIYSKLMIKVSQQWITNESQKRHLRSQAWICLVMSVMYVKLKSVPMYCRSLYWLPYGIKLFIP